MTIHLPENLANPILAAVQSGRFASVDDAMAEAARLLLRQLEQGQGAPGETPTAGEVPPAKGDKTIWERILEMTAEVPEAEWDKLPADSSAQLDHYIYGTPKRPTT
jgi:Arc/MetJ-type ribon-helix-helix transcriptional regulator